MTDGSVLKAIRAYTEGIGYMKKNKMLHYQEYGLLAEQIDQVTLILDKADADCNEKILTTALIFMG